jgi:hypothetical protein
MNNDVEVVEDKKGAYGEKVNASLKIVIVNRVVKTDEFG